MIVSRVPPFAAAALLLAVAAGGVVAAHAQTIAAHHIDKKAHYASERSPAKFVAYDAKDRKYYAVAWAKAHGMRDKGGDKLVIIRRSLLPKDAKLSHAMKGIEP